MVGYPVTVAIPPLPEGFTSALPITFPCTAVRLVPASRLLANDYNPNKVATPEMELLRHSIAEDGFTQPIVTYYDDELDLYLIVDGFHRWTILTREFGCDMVPVVVVEKDVKERIASTIRHNTTGKHKVDLVAVLVEKLLNLGWSDDEIAVHLGMESEEVYRLRQAMGHRDLTAP